MQNTTLAFTEAYNKANSLSALPLVIAEWNHNRFSDSVEASNGGDTTEDANFPISSIVHAIRGRTGLAKGRVGEARTYKSTENDSVQFRTVGPRSNYKYWTTPNASNGATLITDANPQVIYGARVRANKIVIGIEDSAGGPSSWTVSVTTNGTSWSTIASNTSASFDEEGRLVLYLQSNSIWTQSKNLSDNIMIQGVRFSVASMDGPGQHLNVIEVSARLEQDLSDRTMSAGVSRDTDEPSLVFPVGTITANTATLQLDNTDEQFDRDNTDSPYYGLLDTNAEIRIHYGTDVSAYGGGWEFIPQGVYYVDSWGSDTAGSTSNVSCTDVSKFFQQQQMHPVLFENRTAAQIIAEILSSIGFKEYALDISNSENQARIPFVWFTAEQNVWEAIQSICSSTQGTVFTDENGVLRYRSRDKTFENSSDEPDYIITAEDTSERIANLEEVTHNFNVEANKVVVMFRPLVANSRKVPVDRYVEPLDLGPWKRSFTRRQNKRVYDTIPIDSVLWKPEDTVTLRASELRYSMDATQTFLVVRESSAQTWPWSGYMNIEGEEISYDGKQYRWWRDGNEILSVVKSKEEQDTIDDLKCDVFTRHKNSYTGRFENLKRGIRGSKAAAHSVDMNSWSAWRKDPNGAVGSTPTRLGHSGSHMILTGYSGDTNETYTTANRGLFQDQYSVYGTRLMFVDTPYRQGTAGIYFHMQGDRKAGYYVEVNLSSHTIETMKGSINEVRAYRMDGNGYRAALPNSTADAAGVATPVVRNRWYDIEVTFDAGLFRVYFDGKFIHQFTDPQGTLPPGTWGPFIRGHSIVAFEYFYVLNTADGSTPDIEKSSFRHKLNGSYVSGYADREVSRSPKGVLNWYFDDFGPWVHEMRRFNVEFDKYPALDAHVYLSNTWDAYVIEGNRTAFDASFWIANAGRGNATLNGDDPSVYIGGGDVKQQILLYGQVITDDEERSVNVTTGDYTSNTDTENSVIYVNEYAVRKRGVVELSVDSNWIQSQSQARALGEWITNHWSEPVDNISVSGYFNPAIQLGDLVAIDYPDRNMNLEDHRYHVVGISSTADQGLSISLNLRRVR